MEVENTEGDNKKGKEKDGVKRRKKDIKFARYMTLLLYHTSFFILGMVLKINK
jgi:hypothetical protein